jgi:hypothetical protein
MAEEENVRDTPLKQLNLPVRALNALWHLEIHTVGEFLDEDAKRSTPNLGQDQWWRVPNFGKKSLYDVRRAVSLLTGGEPPKAPKLYGRKPANAEDGDLVEIHRKLTSASMGQTGANFSPLECKVMVDLIRNYDGSDPDLLEAKRLLVNAGRANDA